MRPLELWLNAFRQNRTVFFQAIQKIRGQRSLSTFAPALCSPNCWNNNSNGLSTSSLEMRALRLREVETRAHGAQLVITKLRLRAGFVRCRSPSPLLLKTKPSFLCPAPCCFINRESPNDPQTHVWWILSMGWLAFYKKWLQPQLQGKRLEDFIFAKLLNLKSAFLYKWRKANYWSIQVFPKLIE